MLVPPLVGTEVGGVGEAQVVEPDWPGITTAPEGEYVTVGRGGYTERLVLDLVDVEIVASHIPAAIRVREYPHQQSCGWRYRR